MTAPARSRVAPVVLLAFCAVAWACAEAAPPWEEIRAELLAMERADQAAREGFTAASVLSDTARMREMVALDSAHTGRLREIVDIHGWPGSSDVGQDGAGAAWLILQHTPDTAFQRAMVPVMEEAAERGEASRRSLALLIDRVLIRQGLPQRYGTQFRFTEGGIEFHPIEDPESVDERRASVGLPPLEEYRRMSEQFYRVEGEDPVPGSDGSG